MFSKGDLRVHVFQKRTRKNAKIVGYHCSLMAYLRVFYVFIQLFA